MAASEKTEKKGSYDKIKDLEKELSTTKYNKRTQHHIGLVKAKIARLKEKEAQRSSSKGRHEGYSVRRTGDATALLLGFPSVGKSTLLNRLTNADSQIGAYDFTTLDVIPGVMEYKDAKIQILDVPGIVSGAASGRGRGREVLSVIRSCDIVIMLIDVNRLEEYSLICAEVNESGIRINQEKPDVRIKKKPRGGIQIGKTVPLPELDDSTIKGILKELSISNADVLIRTQINADQFIDAVEGNKKYIPSVTVINKVDLASKEQHEKALKLFPGAILISAEKSYNIEKVKEAVYKGLGLIRIFLKEVGKKPDLDVPLIMRQGCTIEDVCIKLHRDFVSKFRFARVWGSSAKFDGQSLRLKHILKDSDIVEIHLR